MSEIEQFYVATRYDGPLRYHVNSASNPHDNHLVELDAYRLNGKCTCQHFGFRLEPLLSRGMGPEQAVAEGHAKLKDGTPIEHALRCKHIAAARAQFTDDAIKDFHDFAKKQANESQRHAAKADPY